ncbi:MAG: prenyltransferase/squalene oxidase repeat-containing protein [Pirellulaceae bacterium]
MNISPARPSALAILLPCLLALPCPAAEPPGVDEAAILAGLKDFYAQTARPDGSFQPGVDPEYLGMSDSAYSDLAAVTYACTIHKTFGWELPHEEQTIEFLLARQRESGEFVNVAGTVDPASPQGKVYNTTQALVALHALGVKPKHDPLPVFEEILKQDYKTLPAYSTSFFPLAYLCAGKPIPEQADRSIRALMIPDDEGYLNDHVAATFHASHYYSLVGEPTPKAAQIVTRVLRDQNKNGSWLLNLPSRDRHATFDAVFTLRHEGAGRENCQKAIAKAAEWALSCRNVDGGFGHFPGSTSDADAVYFQVGTLVMAGVLKPTAPLPKDPHLLSWGHLMPLREKKEKDPIQISVSGWVGGVAFGADGDLFAAGLSDGSVSVFKMKSGASTAKLQSHDDCVTAVAFSPFQNHLATASHDGTAIIWDLHRQAVIHTLKGHRGPVLCLAYLSDETLATGSVDGTIKFWSVMSGKCEQTLSGHKSWVNSLALEPRKNRLISGSSDGTVKIWSTSDGKLLKNLVATKAEVRSVAVSPDGKYLAAGLRYGSAKLWQTDDWNELATLESKADDAWSVVFTADSKQLLVAAGEWNRPTEIAIWDVVSQKRVGSLKHPGEVLGLAVSSDGKFIAAGGGDKTISIWKKH